MRHRTLALALVIATGLAAAASVVEAGDRASIVGRWSTEAGRCERPLSMVMIGPKSLDGDDFTCTFGHVSRDRDVVTFKGACRFGADRPVPETVTARLKRGQLYYRFGSEGGSNGPLIRCA